MLTQIQMVRKVKKHLLKQMKKSKMHHSFLGNICAYRGENGLRCGIGALIPNKKYELSFEGTTPDQYDYCDNAKKLCKAAGIGKADISLAADLQSVHDNYKPSRWSSKLNQIEKDVLAGKYEF